MRVPKRRLRSALALAFVAALLAATPVGAANPEKSSRPSPTPGQGTTSTSDSAQSTTNGAAAAAAVAPEFNPWGCSTRTDQPHASGHFPGTAAALAVHSCTGYFGGNRTIRTYPDTQTLNAWLYYESCFFFVCSWNQADTWSSGPVSSAVAIQISHTLAANCNNGNSTRWRLVANGSSYGFNGSQYQTYYSTSESIATFACGR